MTVLLLLLEAVAEEVGTELGTGEELDCGRPNKMSAASLFAASVVEPDVCVVARSGETIKVR